VPSTLLQITAHSTPHQSDPPNASDFYSMLGMLLVAWGRLEAHVIGNLLTILNFPEMTNSGPLPLVWKERLKLWKRHSRPFQYSGHIKIGLSSSWKRLSRKPRTETL
jgi:hypothetical protein